MTVLPNKSRIAKVYTFGQSDEAKIHSAISGTSGFGRMRSSQISELLHAELADSALRLARFGPIPASVAVREFRAPQYLRQGPIVYRPESEQIAFYDYHRWAEDPRQRVTTAIVRELKQVFESAELYDGRTGAEFLLTGSLDHLEEVDSERSVSVEVGISATAPECEDRQCDVVGHLLQDVRG